MSGINVFFIAVLAYCVQASSALTDSELISRALAAAKRSKDGAQINYKNCRERALFYSVAVPPIGRSENLNEVRIDRKEFDVVTFVHRGTAYDDVDCQVTVQLDKNGKVKNVMTERLK